MAIESLIVLTILPAVEEELGGLSLYGWTFTALTLASFATVPIAGRLTDRLGPRPVLAFALVLYVAGLLIAAAAPSMLVLVAGRFVQGIGGGGLYTVSLGAVAKTYPERIRPRVMALLASMWIVPGLLGPPVGTLIAATLGWRWAFLIPIPADRRRRPPGHPLAACDRLDPRHRAAAGRREPVVDARSRRLPGRPHLAQHAERGD